MKAYSLLSILLAVPWLAVNGAVHAAPVGGNMKAACQEEAIQAGMTTQDEIEYYVAQCMEQAGAMMSEPQYEEPQYEEPQYNEPQYQEPQYEEPMYEDYPPEVPMVDPNEGVEEYPGE